LFQQRKRKYANVICSYHKVGGALSKNEQAIIQKGLDESDDWCYWNEMKFRTVNEKSCT